MPRITLRYVRELQVAFLTLILVALAIALSFSVNTSQQNTELERIKLASAVQQGYQEVSSLALGRLVALGDRVRRGENDSLPDGNPGASALRDAVSRLHKSIAARAAFDRGAGEDEERRSLVEIDRMVEKLIRSSQLIERALREGRFDDARQELEELGSAGLADQFSGLAAAATMYSKPQLPGRQGVFPAPHPLPGRTARWRPGIQMNRVDTPLMILTAGHCRLRSTAKKYA